MVWRKGLEKWVVVEHEYCRWLLHKGFDSVGVNAIDHISENAERGRVNINHAWHYSGNFWWASLSLLASSSSLPIDQPIDHVKRLQAENFILSKMPQMCAASIHQDENLHVYSLEQIPPLGHEKDRKIGVLGDFY